MPSLTLLLRVLAVGLLAFASAPTLGQTRVSFGHFALTDDALRLQVDGVAVAAAQAPGALVQGLVVPAGERSLRVVDGDGNVRAERSVRLLADAPYMIYVASERSGASLAILAARESPKPLVAEEFALQLYSAARHPQDPLRYALRCGPSQVGGALTFGRELVGRIRLRRSTSAGCSLRVDTLVPGPEPVAELAFDPVEGGLQRLVLIGDGNARPWTLRLFEGIERSPAEVVPDALMNGLWFDPDDDGSGLTLTVAPDDAGGHRVTGVLYGYGAGGGSTWALLEGPVNTPAEPTEDFGIRVRESLGGTPQGLRQPIRMNLGYASLHFHSCREATLYLSAISERMPQRLGRTPEDGPEQLFRLRRVLPIDACVRAPASGSGR